MLYNLKLTREEIEQVMYCLTEVNDEHKKTMLKYGIVDELYYVNKIKEYIQNEVDTQDTIKEKKQYE